MLDMNKYLSTVNELHVKLKNVKDHYNTAQTKDALKDICDLLKIGKITADYFQPPVHGAAKAPVSVIIYDDENANVSSEHLFTARETEENGNTAQYTFFPLNGDHKWEHDEYEALKNLQKLISLYAGRSQLINLTDKLTYNDTQLEIHNFAFFMKKAGEFIKRGIIADYSAAHFNIRHFSIINSQVGRDEGTHIMKKYVHGLRAMLSENEYVCRVGGDNFVVLFLKENLDKVCEYLTGVKIKASRYNSEFMISSNAGIYIIDPDECKISADIMNRIVSASNIARKDPALQIVFYDEKMQKKLRDMQMIEDMVPDALKNREFLVYYQPKMDMKNCKIIGAEAICRWKHDGVIIPPDSFIPVIERSKLICELDFYMLDQACRDIRRWLDEGKVVVRISVNMSRTHLGDANLLEDIIGIIDKHNVPHEYIEIELTETTAEVDYKELNRIVTGLRKAGISTAVDDFGIGYSSLSLIRELPWNVLKIDKCFLPNGNDNDEQKKTMLKYVIAMAHALDLECIVEGVETIEHVNLLKDNSCFLAQGYYFDKPLPLEEFETRISC